MPFNWKEYANVHKIQQEYHITCNRKNINSNKYSKFSISIVKYKSSFLMFQNATRCKNAGICEPDCKNSSDYKCQCQAGYTGKNCTEVS